MSGNRINRLLERGSKGKIAFWKELNLSLKRELGGKTPQTLDWQAEGGNKKVTAAEVAWQMT